jgi:6-pyruvoyltetrahydropterin/6-carboxytetrahydropterin synthase
MNEKFLITVAAHFDAAHSIRMPGNPCEKLHGHRWKIEATFAGHLGDGGVVRDFIQIEEELRKRVISLLDHSNLNDVLENPTTELLCRWIWARLAPLPVASIRLWETPAYSVIYRGEGR